jgi:spermidine synthase
MASPGSRGRLPALAVSEARGVRRLHIGGDAIQSAMRVDDPWALALDYTRCMMALLLFHPRPSRVLMIGLGGGSLAKFFRRNLPDAAVRIVECDPRVVTAARDHFLLPQDGRRLKVEIGDGAKALSPDCCDTLVLDGFDDGDQVQSLASAAFYRRAWEALGERGVMVVNYLGDDRKLDDYLVRLERAFGGAVVCLPASADPNVIAFALKGAPESVEWSELAKRARMLEARIDLPFSKYVRALKRMNRWDRKRLHLRIED